LLSVKYSYKEALYATVGVTLDIFFFCIHQFALHRQQPEKDKQNVDFAPPGKISADAHGTELEMHGSKRVFECQE